MNNRRIIVRIGKVLLPLFVLGCAVAGAVWFIKTKPAPTKQKSQESASVVETLVAASGSHTVTVSAMGTVEPVEAITLQSEVTGLIVWKHPNLVPGGRVRKGETLLRVDPRNYEAVVKQQQAALEKAQVDYELELSRSEVAAEEWRMMAAGGRSPASALRATEGRGQESGDDEDGARDETVAARSRTLALREPQLRAAEVAVQAASNALFKAGLDVERTQVAAPFNAVVLDEFVDRGQLVSPQTRLAELAGTDAFRVEASLPVRDLQWMKWPDDDGAGGPAATVLHDIGNAEPLRFDGVVTRVLSSVDGAAHMARILVRVQDPLQLAALRPGKRQMALLSGAYVQVLIEGLALDGLVELPGSVIREGSRIWVMNADSRLEIRDVEVMWRQGGRALVKRGVTDGERIVSSHIPAPIPGMQLRAKGEKTEEQTAQNKSQQKQQKKAPMRGKQANAQRPTPNAQHPR